MKLLILQKKIDKINNLIKNLKRETDDYITTYKDNIFKKICDIEIKGVKFHISPIVTQENLIDNLSSY